MGGWEILGVLLVPLVIWIFSQHHSKPGRYAHSDHPCMYCGTTIKAEALEVLGKKGWGHVECVEL